MIRTIRAAKNITQEDVSRDSGISVSTISRIETGRYNPTDEELEKLQKALGVTFEEVETPFQRFLRSIGET